MASSNKRSRKSFFGRLKPLIGRLRGKEPVQNEAGSPTSVAELFLEHHQANQPEIPENGQEDNRLNLEVNRKVFGKEIDDISSFSQSAEENASGENDVSPFPSKPEGATGAAASNTMQPGQLLRDFLSASPAESWAQRDTLLQEELRPESPIRKNGSSTYELDEGLDSAGRSAQTYTSAAAAGDKAHPKEVHTVTVAGTENSETKTVLSTDGTAQPVTHSQFQSPAAKNSAMFEMKESDNSKPEHNGSSTQDTPIGGKNEENLFSTFEHTVAPEQKLTSEQKNDSATGSIDDNDGGNEKNAASLRFPIGVTVDVIAPTSKYKGKRVKIIDVKKKVKVEVPTDNNEVKETWLARTSLSYYGVTPFPPSDDSLYKSTSKSAPSKFGTGTRKSEEVANTTKSEEFMCHARSPLDPEKSATSNDIRRDEDVEDGNAAIQSHEISNRRIANRTSEGKTNGVGTPSDCAAPTNNGKGWIRPGVRVFVIGSKKYNRFGTVVKVHSLMVTVDIEGHGRKRVKQSAVKLANGEEQQQSEALDRNLQSRHSSDTPLRNGFQQYNGSKKRAPEDIQKNDWRIVDSDKGTTYFGNRKQIRTRFQLPRAGLSTKRGQEETFLSHFFQNRLREIEIPLNDDEIQESISNHFTEPDGSQYELVSAKTYSDAANASFGAFCSPEKVVLVYCKVAGPGLQTISLQHELERIADFGHLDKAKVVCRLELLQSPAYKFKSHPYNEHGIFPLDPCLFGKIAENGNEGCGFICEELLSTILGGNKAAKRACAIQVRGYVPKIGVVKGMLCKKRLPSGVPIEIPSSMIKVGASLEHHYSHKAFLTITKNGVHPSLDPSSMNNMIGRLLYGTKTTKSFRKQLQKKKLSDMILRLWKGMGVPEQDCKQYADASLSEHCLEHAFVIGLADPTNQLPPGTIFCPGLSHACKDLFVTRSPCIESSDGRVIAPVTAKPDDMSHDNWEFLQTFPFGCILFANPRPGEMPMPVMIADGDLDGDLYFVCWNRRILDLIESTPMHPMKMNDEDTPPMKRYNAEWLVEAQERMADIGAGRKLRQIIARLYNAAQNIAEASEDFMNDEDYQHLAQAYKEALKIEKHGGTVQLPVRLHHHIPTKCHCILSDTGET